MQAEARMSSQLQSALDEERSHAAQDRHDLLSQITSLVNKSGEVQDTRWQSKMDTIKSDIASSRSTLESEEKRYNEAMNVWSQKENLLVEEVLKSRDTLKSRMKKDWTVSFLRSKAVNVAVLTNAFLRLLTNETLLFKQLPNLFTKKRSA